MAQQIEDDDRLEDAGAVETERDEQEGSTERDVDVSEREGKTEVDVHRESRRERKDREFAERRQKELDTNLAPIRQQNEALQAQLRDLSALLNRRPEHLQPESRKQSARQIDPELETIKRKQAALLRRAKTAATDKEADEIEAEYHQLDQDAIDLRVSKGIEERLKTYRPPQPMNYQEQRLRSEFGDVFSDPEAERYAAAIVQQAELAAKRRGDTIDPMKVRQDALTKAATDFGLRKATTPAPKPSQAARLANRGSSAGMARGNDKSVRRTLTPDERKAAIASGDPDKTPEQNIARWTRAMEKEGYWDTD